MRTISKLCVVGCVLGLTTTGFAQDAGSADGGAQDAGAEAGAQDAGAEDAAQASGPVSFCAALGNPAICNGLDDTATCAEGFVCTDGGGGAFYCIGQGDSCDPEAPEACPVTSTCLTFYGPCVDGACSEPDAMCDTATNQCRSVARAEASGGTDAGTNDGGATGSTGGSEDDAGTSGDMASGDGGGVEEAASSDGGGCSAASGAASGTGVLWLVGLAGYMLRRRRSA